jgi:hypothetical protein
MTTTRRFNIDRYLDQQLAQQKEAQRQETAEAVAAAGSAVERYCGWAIRLNDRCERILENTNWAAFDVFVTRKVVPVLASGIVIYFAIVLADAFVRGAFSLGGN